MSSKSRTDQSRNESPGVLLKLRRPGTTMTDKLGNSSGTGRSLVNGRSSTLLTRPGPSTKTLRTRRCSSPVRQISRYRVVRQGPLVDTEVTGSLYVCVTPCKTPLVYHSSRILHNLLLVYFLEPKTNHCCSGHLNGLNRSSPVSQPSNSIPSPRFKQGTLEFPLLISLPSLYGPQTKSHPYRKFESNLDTSPYPMKFSVSH